jgi:hypothetical protein
MPEMAKPFRDNAKTNLYRSIIDDKLVHLVTRVYHKHIKACIQHIISTFKNPTENWKERQKVWRI